MRSTFPLFLAFALSGVASAQPAHLVADLAPGSVRGSIAVSAPTVAIGDDVYFEAVDPTYFGQVWKTNGTPGDLKRLTAVEGLGIRTLAGFDGKLCFVGFEAQGVSLRRISPPAENSEVIALFHDTQTLTPIDTALLFPADDGVHGWEPWRTDGTSEGTFVLADLVPGGESSSPFGFITADGTFAFFFAATDAGQSALWRTDGTSAGTRRIAGFGTAPSDGFRPSVLGVVAGKLLFTTYKGDGRFRLWSSDGTEAGTGQIAEFAGDFASHPFSHFPWGGPSSNGTTAGGFLYFTANDGAHGREPWRTNGTGAGTRLVGDLYPGTTGSDASDFAPLGDSVVFSALDPVHGSEPWIASAAIPGARLVRDIHPGPAGVVYGFFAVGDFVYFTADDGNSGGEPWRTDGTFNGTLRVADIAPGPPGSATSFFFAKDGETFFTADSGEGRELWKTDGSEAGTTVVEDLAAPASAYPLPAADVSGRLFFSTLTTENGDAGYRRLWVTTGLSETTAHLRDFLDIGPSGFEPTSFLSLGGVLYFAADDGPHGDEPWISDGTVAGTEILADLVPPGSPSGIPDSNPYAFTPFRGRIAFVAGADPSAHPQLWQTDGTAAGTRLITDISPGWANTETPLFPFGTNLFFAAREGASTELWRSDGTAAGTVAVKSLGPGGIYRMVAAGGAFYFVSGNSLWRSDGTGPGTLPVFTSEESIDPYRLETVRGIVFFLVGNSATLWRTDGTEAGTFALTDGASEPTAAGSFVFFAHDDGVHGSELWRTDGTVDGTVLVRDIRPGDVGSYPGDFAAVGDSIWFSASDGVHGTEPWRSDGTGAGTALVADVLPGIGSSFPRDFRASGERVYFTANDGAHGYELWAAPFQPARSRRIVAPRSRPAPPVLRPRSP